jgi:3-hydroxyacyl-[acyl-carrier-protein] dehydratase
MGIDGARFRRPVVPGDRLELSVEITKRKDPVWKERGEARVDGELVAEADFMAMLAEPPTR